MCTTQMLNLYNKMTSDNVFCLYNLIVFNHCDDMLVEKGKS